MPPSCPNCPSTTRPITIHPTMKRRYNVKGQAYACDNCGAIMDKKGNITNLDEDGRIPAPPGFADEDAEFDEWGNRMKPARDVWGNIVKVSDSFRPHDP